MALDPSIALAYRAPQFENPLARFGQVAQIQNAQNSNRLADLQYRQALQSEADTNALRRETAGVDLSTPEGLRQAQNAFLKLGKVKDAHELGRNALADEKTRGEINAQRIKAAADQFGAFSAALAPLVSRPTLTHDDVFPIVNRLEASGLVNQKMRSMIPMDAAQLPGFVKQLALETEQGRKTLEAALPKVTMDGDGASRFMVNTNPLAANVPLGRMAGVPSITMQNTPGELLTDERTRSEGRLNRGVTRRGQDMVDARAKETLQAGRAPAGYRFKADGALEAIPGGPADGKADKLGDAAKKQVAGIDALDSAIDAYTKALKTWSRTDAMNPSKVAVMGTLYNNMMLQAKEAFGLGVLNGPDYDILQSVVRDPTKGMSLVFSPDDLSNQATTLKNLMVQTRAQIKNQGRGEGAQPSDMGADGAPKPKPKVGDVVKGYLFKGGDPADPKSWEKAR